MSISPAPCSPSVDLSFEPYAGGSCRGGFDFTVTFEEAILSIPVSSLLIAASLWRVLLLKQRTKKTRWKWLLSCKLAGLSFLVVVNLVFLVFVALPDERRGPISIASAVLQLVASMALMILSYFEHVQTLRPSTIISLYLLALLLLDSARMRTMALISAGDGKSITFAASMVLKVANLVIESSTKSDFISRETKAVSPEATSNIFIRSTFMWLRKLLLVGYTRVVTIGDLFSLDPVMDSEHLASKFRAFALEKAGRKNWSTSLLVEALWNLRWPILAAVPARLITMSLTFAQPFLLSDLVGLASRPVSREIDQVGYGLIGAFILVYIGLAISACQYSYKMVRVVTMMRGGLVSLVYARSMRLHPADQARAGAALTHMNADVELIAGGAASFHELWASPVEIGVGIWLVERQLGVACLIPVVVAIAAGGCTFIISKRVNSAQTAWVAKITERIAATGVTLGSASGLRLAGLLDKSLDLLQDIRESELRASKPFRKLLIVNMLLAYISPVLTPVLTFVVFSLVSSGNSGAPFTISRAFSSLALLNVIANPLTTIISMVPSLIVSYNSFHRIQQYCERSDDSPAKPTPAPSLHNDEKPSRLKMQGSHSSSDSDDAAVIIEKGYFSWTPGALAGVEDVNMTVRKGAFAMIVGPTGSGKSTILKGLVKEIPDVRGVLYYMSGPIGYCAQAPWLPAGTAREVITAGSPLDDEWYKSVTSACQLREDFGAWEDGDQHNIGSAGAALSGGQKQRMALARCLYSKAKLMLLDDTLTGLDLDTKLAILEKVFGPEGLIQRLGATIILASSTRSHSEFADIVIEIGDSTDPSTTTDAADASTQQAISVPAAEPPEPKLSLPKHITDAMGMEEPPPPPPKQEATPSSLAENVSNRDSSSSNEGLKDEEVDAEHAKQYGGRGAYKYYLKPVTWPSLIIFIISIVIFTFCQAFPSVWLKMWVEHQARYPNTQPGMYLGIYAALGVGCIIAIAVASWNFFVDMIPQTGSFFHKILAKTVSNAPLSTLVTTEAGETTSRFSQDLQLIDMELPLSTMNTFASLTICIANAVIVAVAGRYVAIAFPIVIAILFFIQKFYLRTSRQLRLLDLETKAPLYSRFLECISGLGTIQAFRWEEHYERKQWAFLDTSQQAFYLFQCLQRWLTVTIDLLVALFAIVLATVLVQTRSSIGGGYIAVGLVNIMSFNGQLKAVILHWTSMEIALGAIARIRGFEKATTNENDHLHTIEAPPHWPSDGAVQIKNLNVTYGKSKTPTLKDISLNIRPREKVAICGRTGSGKSTLLLAILRMLDHDQGSSILIDGVDIQTLSRKQVRSQITYVSQEPAFIMDKVKTNLDPEGTATEEAMIEVLTKVGLWQMIQAAGGLEMTPMQLLPLSPGQKQLFVLARAMLRPKKIVVLDEPTSTVDDDTANRIKELMRTEFAASTVLNIAHRLETIRGYDKVLVLRDGRVAAYDSVSAVLEN